MSHIPYYGQPESKGKSMTTNNKNGYEIRAHILELAKDYVEKQARLNIEYAEKMQALGKMRLEEYVNAFKPYTMEEVMAKATEMYSFVAKK